MMIIYPLSGAKWLSIPTTITMGVMRKRGVTERIFLRPVLIYPEPWAMPMPSVATMTMPRGGKPAKFETILVIRVTRLFGASMFVTMISFPVVGWI